MLINLHELLEFLWSNHISHLSAKPSSSWWENYGGWKLDFSPLVMAISLNFAWQNVLQGIFTLFIKCQFQNIYLSQWISVAALILLQSLLFSLVMMDCFVFHLSSTTCFFFFWSIVRQFYFVFSNYKHARHVSMLCSFKT